MTPAPSQLPPQNLDAEIWTIAGCLIENAVLDEVATFLEPGDFWRDDHQTIYRAIRDVYGAGNPVDSLILSDELERRGELERVGGAEFVAEITNTVPHAVNTKYYAQIVKQKAVARELVELARETEREAQSNNFTAAQLVENAERRFFALADADSGGSTVRVGDAVTGVLEAIYRRADGKLAGLPSGLHDLDDVTGGFQPGNLIYLAARTSMGKTSLGLNVAEHLAVDHEIPVLFVSLEMSRAEIIERMIVSRSMVDGYQLRTGRARNHAPALQRAHDQIKGAPLFIDDTPGRTAHQIAANARRFRSREDVQLLVVDLINHVAGDDPRASRREQLCVISLRLKAVARELAIPVLVLAQLNRGPDNREGNRPRKSDLKECGNLEEDADLVLLLHRPEYYDPNDRPGTAEVIVDKNRNGPTRDVQVMFHRHLMRFDNLYIAPAVEFIPPPADF